MLTKDPAANLHYISILYSFSRVSTSPQATTAPSPPTFCFGQYRKPSASAVSMEQAPPPLRPPRLQPQHKVVEDLEM